MRQGRNGKNIIVKKNKKQQGGEDISYREMRIPE